jgi:hypothetical protein
MSDNTNEIKKEFKSIKNKMGEIIKINKDYEKAKIDYENYDNQTRNYVGLAIAFGIATITIFNQIKWLGYIFSVLMFFSIACVMYYDIRTRISYLKLYQKFLKGHKERITSWKKFKLFFL